MPVPSTPRVATAAGGQSPGAPSGAVSSAGGSRKAALAVITAADMLRGGPAALTMAGLAERLGVSVGGLYRYYPGKSAILVGLEKRAAATFARVQDQLLSGLEARLRGRPARVCALARILTAAAAYSEHARRAPVEHDLMAQLLAVPEQLVDEAEARDILEHVRPVIERSGALLAAAIERNRPDQQACAGDRDQEGDQRVQEEAVAERDGAGVACRLDGGEGLGRGVAEHDEEVAEVGRAGDGGDEGHEDVADEGGDDGGEGRADNDADGHVDHAPLERELLEFLEHENLPGGEVTAAGGAPATGTTRRTLALTAGARRRLSGRRNRCRLRRAVRGRRRR